MSVKIKAYKKEFDYSYTTGASSTIELLRGRPGIVECVYIHSSYRGGADIGAMCEKAGIRCVESDRIFRVLNQKENSYVLGVFHKYSENLMPDRPHIVLVNPSDMGNLGTIIRTIAGMNIGDLAIIEPAADVWNPKAVRASMGAFFHIRTERYQSFEDYRERYPDHALFPFMLKGEIPPEDAPPAALFSLIFGNEASGLDERFSTLGTSVRIPLSERVDSFNLAVAAGIGVYVFARKNHLI